MYHRTQSRWNLQRFPGRAQKCRARFTTALRCVTQHGSRRHCASRKQPRKWSVAWKIPVKILHQRRPYAMKFDDRPPGETARQERCDRGDAWELARKIYKLKKRDKAASYSPVEEWIKAAASTTKPEERRVCGRFRSEHAHGQ